MADGDRGPITIYGLGKVLAKFEKLEAPASVLRRPLAESSAYIVRRLKQKPVKSKGAFSRLATDAQRRAYWARVKSGAISHGPNGYIRTGNTAKAWNYKIEISQRSAESLISNNRYAARFVYGKDEQQRFHEESGWPRVDLVAKDAKAVVIRIFEDQLDRFTRG